MDYTDAAGLGGEAVLPRAPRPLLDVQRAGAATLLGQPTGGNLRGLNSGQICWVTLPVSGVGVDIPAAATGRDALDELYHGG